MPRWTWLRSIVAAIAGFVLAFSLTSGASAVSRPLAHPTIVAKALAKSYVVERPCASMSVSKSVYFTYSVPKGPGGSRAEQFAVVSMVICIINGTPKGSSLSLTQYDLNNSGVVTALIKAVYRGVNLYTVSSRQHTTKQTKRLAAAIKAYKAKMNKAKRSAHVELKMCNHSCGWGGSGGIQHAKGLASSCVVVAEGRCVSNVIMLMSGNADPANERQWNVAETFTGKPKLYKSLSGVIRSYKHDRTMHYQSVTEGGVTLAYTPTHQSMLSLNAVRAFPCNKGTGVIDVGMYIFANRNGKAAASVLMTKVRQGCDVNVVYSSLRSRASVIKLLRGYCAKSPYGKRCVAVNDAVKRVHGRLVAYTHTKFVAMKSYKLVHGKLVYAYDYVGGSRNWSDNSHNTEITVRVRGNAWLTNKALAFWKLLNTKSS